MSNKRRPFTCYFCNQLIENETEMGHTTLCSKVLIPCPYKCGSYIQRANLVKHKTECNNKSKTKSISFDLDPSTDAPVTNTNSLGRQSRGSRSRQSSLDRNSHSSTSQPRLQDDIAALQRRFSDLEARISSPSPFSNTYTNNSAGAYVRSNSYDDIKGTLQKHSLSIQKVNYFNGFMSEWKKNVDAQITSLKNSLASVETIKKESGKQWSYMQEKILHLQNLQMDLNLLRESIFKDNASAKKTEVDFARNLEEIRSIFNQQNISFENMWSDQTGVVQDVIKDVQNVKKSIDEQKAKYAGLVFDIRSASQISSEAAEKIEILEREFNIMRREVNQMKVNIEILEDLNCSNSVSYKRLIWRVTEVESKLKRAKDNDIVLKSPIFYTHHFGYKIRVLLYINGLKKWRDRYALACLHVLKGEYDPLLNWPCVIEGHITLRDLVDKTQTKNFSKYIRIKRASGDEEEDEPQESSSTYIFIPHSVLFKDNYLKNDSFFLDININDNNLKYETNL